MWSDRELFGSTLIEECPQRMMRRRKGSLVINLELQTNEFPSECQGINNPSPDPLMLAEDADIRWRKQSAKLIHILEKIQEKDNDVDNEVKERMQSSL